MSPRRDAVPVTRRALLGGAVGLALGATAGGTADAEMAAAAPTKVLYVSHGSPLFAVDARDRIAELRAWGARLAPPRGIVIMTPHVASRGIAVGATGQGFAMYDLPRALKRRLPKDIDYPTPPSEAIALRIEAIFSGSVVTRGTQRGFDHTTWMPLLCLFPKAEVPVLELAYPYLSEPEQLAFGRKLAPLREEGYLFVASGGMTHNLAAVTMGATDPSPVTPWAQEFDAWATETVKASDVDALLDWRRKAPAASLAHPDDGAHFRVLLVAMGIALGGSRPARGVRFPIGGFESTMSKRCIEIG
jgi:4,5-DOPA dioxygenase extradiol